MNYYRMSETGACPRVLTARGLGYEAAVRPVQDEHRLRYYTLLESIAAQQMADQGYVLEEGGLCEQCGSHGIHVELSTALFKLTGHLDRRLVLSTGVKVPVEIKSIGRFTFQKMENSSVFAVYPEYAAQMACYMEAEKMPGIYWVMNRDTGDNIKYIVNDTKGVLTPSNLGHFSEFTQVTLPVTYQEIVDRLNNVEILLQEKELAPSNITDSCRWCDYKYLCIKEEKEEVAVEESDKTLVEAAQLYKEGNKYKKLYEDATDQAKAILLKHALSTNKYKVSGVSVSYRGMTKKKLINESLIPEEILKKAIYYSNEYPDITIRILKEK